MAKATFNFPRGFLWGTATAAHQVEGNNTNNQWWAWEQQEGHIAKGHQSGLACDWWGGRWKEDLDRAAEGGQNAHRLSVEWSRIQPKPDRWDEDALEHYRQILRGLRERGMTAMVTLHHFSNPLWFEEMGGWENDAAVGYFEEFVLKTVEALREYATLWCTLNEPNGYVSLAYLVGIFPPGKRDHRLFMKAMANLVRAHAAAYHAIHEIQPEARAGIAMYYRSIVPLRSWSPLDRLVANVAFNMINNTFPSALASGVIRTPFGTLRIPEAKGTQDFFGFNYYSRDIIAFDLRQAETFFVNRFYPEGADLSDTGFLANIPEGMFEGLKWVVRKFPGLPIIITENGVECSDDHIRPRYIAQHIHQVWRGINFNWPIKGYFHWTLVDNFEWERGWTQRFGLWALNFRNQARRKRRSADFYAEICKGNCLSSDMVQKYCPEIYETMFPG